MHVGVLVLIMHVQLLAQNFREARREQKRAARRITNGQHTREYTFADHELGDPHCEITSAVSIDLGFPGAHISTRSFAVACVAHTRFMSGIKNLYMSHVTHTNESRRWYELSGVRISYTYCVCM